MDRNYEPNMYQLSYHKRRLDTWAWGIMLRITHAYACDRMYSLTPHRRPGSAASVEVTKALMYLVTRVESMSSTASTRVYLESNLWGQSVLKTLKLYVRE